MGQDTILLADLSSEVTDNLLDSDQHAELTKFSQTFGSSSNVPSDIGTVYLNAAASQTMTLLSVDAVKEGATFTFKDYADNAETYTYKIATQGSETIAGVSEFTFTKNGQAVTLKAYSGNWHIVGDALAVDGGGGGGTDAQSIWGDAIQDGLADDITDNNKQLTAKWLVNLLAWPVDISQPVWTGSNIASIDGTDGIIGSAANTFHRIQQSVTVAALEDNVLCADVEAGNVDHCILAFAGNGLNSEAWFDIGSEATGTKNNVDLSKISKLPNGKYRVCAQVNRSVDSASVYVYPAEADNDYDYLGDGLTVDLRVTNLQVYPGKIADNLEFYDSGNAPEPGKTEWVQEPKSGAGELQRVDTGAYEVPVDDVEYYNGFKDGAQAYYMQRTVEVGADATTVIEPDFLSNVYVLSSHRFFAVNDATPTTKYSVPKPTGSPSINDLIVNTTGLTILRSGTGLYPGWSYIGGYTYFK